MKKILLIILGGMIVRDESGGWRSSNIYDAGDKHGIADDELRYEAGATFFAAHKEIHDLVVLVSGGKGQLAEIEDAPSVAEVGSRILSKYGIPEEKIILEENSGNTLSQLYEIAKIYQAGDYDSIQLITNEFHIPRVETMMRHDKILQKEHAEAVELISAEEILLAHDPLKWKERIEQARRNPLMQKRLTSEQQGIKDFLAGTYRSTDI